LLLSAVQASAGYRVGIGAAKKTSNMDIQLVYFGKDAHDKYFNAQDMAATISATTGMCLFDVCTAVTAATRGAITVTSAAATCSEGAAES
jgi:hypothetical protein